MESKSKEGLVDCGKIGQGRSSPQYQNIRERLPPCQEGAGGVDVKGLRA